MLRSFSRSVILSFWMDNQTRGPQSKDVVMPDNDAVPLYDRGYTLGLIPFDGSGNVESRPNPQSMEDEGSLSCSVTSNEGSQLNFQIQQLKVELRHCS